MKIEDIHVGQQYRVKLDAKKITDKINPNFWGAVPLSMQGQLITIQDKMSSKVNSGNWYYKPEALEEIEPPEPSIEENPQYKEDKLKFLSLLQTKKIKTRHEEYIQG